MGLGFRISLTTISLLPVDVKNAWRSCESIDKAIVVALVSFLAFLSLKCFLSVPPSLEKVLTINRWTENQVVCSTALDLMEQYQQEGFWSAYRTAFYHPKLPRTPDRDRGASAFLLWVVCQPDTPMEITQTSLNHFFIGAQGFGGTRAQYETVTGMLDRYRPEWRQTSAFCEWKFWEARLSDT